MQAKAVVTIHTIGEIDRFMADAGVMKRSSISADHCFAFEREFWELGVAFHFVCGANWI